MPRVSQRKEALDMVYKDAVIRMLQIWDETEMDELVEETELIIYRISLIVTSLPRQLNWTNEVLPLMDDSRFRTMLRLTREQYYIVLDLIKDHDVFHSNTLQFPVSIQLAIALYRMGHYGNAASSRNIATLFGIGDGSTITRITRRVIEAILPLEKKYIYWPNEEERKELEINELPGCFSWIDGTDVKLAAAPSHDKASYFDKNKNCSVKMNLICDKTRRIRHYRIGYPGSVHDGAILKASNIGKNPENFLNEGQWIAGDKGFTLTKFFITPFRENSRDMTKREIKIFNKYFSHFRIIIEHVNGALKNTFQSLKELRLSISEDKNSSKDVNEWILACLILFNIILPLQNYEPTGNVDNDNGDDANEPEHEENVNENGGREKRIEIAKWVINMMHNN